MTAMSAESHESVNDSEIYGGVVPLGGAVGS